MKSTDIRKLRLMSQHLSGPGFKSAVECVGWLGAMQAQDYNMAKWAIGIRVSNATETSINKAIDKGEIIRTHVLRPTWHFVPAKDVYWMLDLTAQHIKNSMRSRNKQLELDEKTFAKSNKVFEKALDKHGHLTREELVEALTAAKIATNDSRSLHLLLYAELTGLIGSGPTKGIKNSYALLERRVHKPKPLHREEALAKLAQIYFTSHGPATIKDFAWWSGLPLKEINQALAFIKKDLTCEKIGEQIFWFSNSLKALKTKAQRLQLLPAFDELIISYRDRSAAISTEHHQKAISSNGIFNPTIVLDGQVIGTWKRTLKKDTVTIEPAFFNPAKSSEKLLLKKAVSEYVAFLNKESILLL